jgi:hypothetical protein
MSVSDQVFELTAPKFFGITKEIETYRQAHEFLTQLRS